MEIAILRHGKPSAFPSENRISASAFYEWVQSYNASSLDQSSIPTGIALAYANECGITVSSSLQRSIDSAIALNKDKFTLSDAVFMEAGMPSASWNFLKLPPNLWAVIFRVLWVCGYSNESESITEANTRAAKAAVKLVALAQTHQRVLFVGHGVFNRLLAKELRRMGWSGPKNPGSSYWSFGVYEQ